MQGKVKRMHAVSKPLCLLAFTCFSAGALVSAEVNLKQSAHQIDVSVDGKPFTTYSFDPDIAKPFLMPLRTASGIIVTRSFPVRNDVSLGNPKAPSFEPHQRPLYFGHGDIDGLDFWQEQVFDKFYDDHGHQAYGHVVLKSLDEASGDHIRARFTLNDPNGRVLGEEQQSFTFGGDSDTRIIDCEFVLNATAGPLDIGDTKEGTFAIRLAPELSAPHEHMINSAGGEGEKSIWGKRADWVDYSGTIAGQQVGVAVFDSPRSFHHPTTWHARAYGLLAANPFGLREFSRDPDQDGSRAIPEGKSLRFRYRVLIHQGSFGKEQISRAYAAYTAGER
jgi:Methane oxygenase PmoA